MLCIFLEGEGKGEKNSGPIFKGSGGGFRSFMEVRVPLLHRLDISVRGSVYLLLDRPKGDE